MTEKLLGFCLLALGLSACGDPAGTGAGPTDPGTLPRLGVYAVGVDGSSFRLLLDPGTRDLTHVRKQPGGDWLTATRYNVDPDRNGLSMEIESGHPNNYAGAEIVVFPMSQPNAITKVAGAVPGKLCANSSWTADGKLLFIQQDHPTNPDWTRFKRASFSALPTVAQIDPVPAPPELLLPVDPHQVGPSDGTGSIVFAALFQHPSGWMRPVWRMPAAGATSLAGASFVGCPICPANNGCCAWPTFPEVLGANDPQLNHAGTDVIWMQQHPNVSAGSPRLYPYRQQKKPASGPQVDLTAPGVAPLTSQTFAVWREDDREVVYWAIELEGTKVRQNLYRMNPDGTERRRIPIPAQLCASHPNYISATEIVFSGWRCAGTECTCDVGKL